MTKASKKFAAPAPDAPDAPVAPVAPVEHDVPEVHSVFVAPQWVNDPPPPAISDTPVVPEGWTAETVEAYLRANESAICHLDCANHFDQPVSEFVESIVTWAMGQVQERGAEAFMEAYFPEIVK